LSRQAGATVGTLYVVGAPAGDPDDITLRAQRTLSEVALVAADPVTFAQRLLVRYDLDTPFVEAADTEALLTILETDDIALLIPGWLLAPSGPSQSLINTAVERGFPVIPIPGPSLPMSALVSSGLPADSFVYVGTLPEEPGARRDLLTLVAAERRTLVALESPAGLQSTLAELHEICGDRSLVVMPISSGEGSVTWRGTTGDTAGQELAQLLQDPSVLQGPCTLVVGGSRPEAVRWDEDQLQAEIQTHLRQGLGTKELSRQLALKSGWPRREVYRLAVETAATAANEGETA
jgi:16S rRNA (cytidine1402-2'-O)-methyltransferase